MGLDVRFLKIDAPVLHRVYSYKLIRLEIGFSFKKKAAKPGGEGTGLTGNTEIPYALLFQ